MTATQHRDVSPFRLTGDSHADLDRMEARGAAAMPALPDRADRRRRRDDVRAYIAALSRLVGVGATEQLRRVAEEVAIDADDAERALAVTRDSLHRVQQHYDDAVADRERARDLACWFEAELARMRDPWIGRYLEALEAAVGDDVRDRIVAEVNADVAANPPVPRPASAVVLPDPGLPVVDDASIGEGELQFRRLNPTGGGMLVAVGRLDRVFAPLDTATEIAYGAARLDAPDDPAHPLDETGDDASNPL